MPIVYPYVSGQAYIDAGRYTGDWQTSAMSPVLTAPETPASGIYGVVDGEGRAAVLYPSLARTATPTAYSLQSRGAKGLAVFINASAITSTPSVVVTIDGYNAGSGIWYNILTSAAIATVSTKRMVVAPGIVENANLTVSTLIPETVRVVMTHANVNSITYSVDLDWV